MTKAATVLVSAVLAMGIQSSLSAAEKGVSEGAAKLTDQDRHALDVGRKVVKIRSALQEPEKKGAIDAIRSLGLDTRYYVMVRGWIAQHISMTESYTGTTAYKESAQRRKEIDGRIAALQKMLRAIDLE